MAREPVAQSDVINHRNTPVSRPPGLIESIGLRLSRRRKFASEVTLSRHNIYIFPSPAGFAFLVMLLIMLLTAINYQNSLIYLLTFTLAAIFFVSIWLCFFAFSGIEISAGEPGEVEEGDALAFSYRLRCDHDVDSLLCGFSGYESAQQISFDGGEHQALSVWLPATKRGVHRAPPLRLETRYPFGLVRAWTYARVSAQVYVYPSPREGLPTRHAGNGGKAQYHNESETDAALRHHRDGDSPQRIIWKHYASKDVLVVRDSERTSIDETVIHWDDYEGLPPAERLRHLAHDVLQQQHRRQRFSFSIPGSEVPAGIGAEQIRRCLRALAAYGQTSEGDASDAGWGGKMETSHARA